MLRATALATLAAAAMLAAPIASAQQIDLGGRGGPRIDLRSPEQRHEDRMDRRMERDRAERRMMSRDRDRGDGYGRRGGGDGCRTVSVTDTDSYGRRVTRTRRSCD